MKWNEAKQNDSIWKMKNEKSKKQKKLHENLKNRRSLLVSLALRRATINVKGQRWQLPLQLVATLHVVAIGGNSAAEILNNL